MRKWVLVGLVGVIGAGGLILLYRSVSNSIEYHKRGFEAASDRFHEITPPTMERFKKAVARIRKVPYQYRLDDAKRMEYQRQADAHFEALVQLGYLKRRTLAVTNDLPSAVARRSMLLKRRLPPPKTLARYAYVHYFVNDRTNVIVVTARGEDMARLEAFIREADVKTEVRTTKWR